MNVCFETFGCRLNRAEALEDEARCRAAGHQIVRDHASADLIVVRGCSVTARAERDSARLVTHLRKKYPLTRTVTTGCLPGARPFSLPNLPTDFVASEATARAYLKVQDGCNGKCTYCIIPHFRGPSRSLPLGEVLRRVDAFLARGYREIVVTGCNLADYADGAHRLADLLAAVCARAATEGCRVRLGSLEPGDGAAEAIEALAAAPNACPFVHLAVQSGSGHVLHNMGRTYDFDRVRALVRRIRNRWPSVALGCDLIAGFPAERQLDHQSSLLLVKDLQFTNVHAFPYSERPGTPAATYALPVASEIRRQRARELGAAGYANRLAYAARFKNRVVEVVVEDPRRAAGWTREHLAFALRDGAPAERAGRALYPRRGVFPFRVTSVEADRLFGVPLSSQPPSGGL